MDAFKKRKTDENGAASLTGVTPSPPSPNLTPDDIRKILDSFPKDDLLDILQSAALIHPDVLQSIRSIADRDTSLRKLFIRGLSSETTSETLSSIFSAYGELDEAIVIHDKNTGKSKGFGFITFKHVDSALIALKEPSKKIDGRISVTQLASAGVSSSGTDVSLRKIYVGNVPFDIPSERLLEFFMLYGKIEEGPLGFDKTSGKSRGFAFIIYKTEEGARAAIAEPMKTIDGHQIVCKLAADNKKVKPPPQQGSGDGGPQAAQQGQTGVPGSQYAMGQGYGGYSGLGGVGAGGYGLNNPAGTLPVSAGGGGYGVGVGAAAGAGAGAGGGGGSYGVSQFGGPGGSGEFGGMNSAGNSMYRMPPSSIGRGAGGYPEGGPYGLSQQHQPPPMPPRVPPGPGGMYQGMPPYF